MSAGGPDDFDELLREVESTLNPSAAPPPKASPPARRAESEPQVRPSKDASDDDSPGGIAERLAGGLVAGAVSGGVVWVLFALLPFVSSFSGAVGAFLAAFVVWVVRGR